MQFMTPQWAEAYTQAWNSDSKVMKKLKKLSFILQFSLSDREDLEPVVIEVKKGVCTTFGTKEQYDNIEFYIWGDTDSWKKIFDSDISIQKAMKSDGFGFKGPKLKAMMNMSGLERGISIMREMKEVTV